MVDEDSVARAAESAARAANAAARAKAEAEVVSIIRRRQARREAIRRGRDGEYAERKTVKAAGQIVIPKPILLRWGYDEESGLDVVLLDLEWAVLVLPESAAQALLQDLNIDLSPTWPVHGGAS